MQLKVLLIKDLSSLFKQKAVVFTLLFPMIIIIFIGVLPLFLQSAEPFEIGYLIEDDGITIDNSTLNLGNDILLSLNNTLANDDSIKLVKLDTYDEFISFENAIYIPGNFTEVANYTRVATYYLTMSDSNIRAQPIMTGTIAQIIDKVVTEKLIPVIPPKIEGEQVFSESELLDNGVAKNRGAIAFPLAYIAFLILIMGSSSMRLTGFSAEREADMMELLLSSVVHRSEMILSKLIIGVIYGFATVMAYITGFAIVLIVNFNTNDSELLTVPKELITVTNVLAIIFLFVSLSFLSIEFLLAMQLLMGKEGGDKFGSSGLMILTILFYATSIADPLAETPIQVINPFFWPFKVSLNIIFKENLVGTMIYLMAIFAFSTILLLIQTRAIENEKVLFE